MADKLLILAEAVQKGDDKKAVALVQEALDAGTATAEIIEDGLVPGVRVLGQLFKDGEVYLPEILISTRAMNRGLAVLGPHLAGADIRSKGTIVVGTVEGNLHDIGKKLVAMMLGGAPVTRAFADEIDAEGYAEATGRAGQIDRCSPRH